MALASWLAQLDRAQCLNMAQAARKMALTHAASLVADACVALSG